MNRKIIIIGIIGVLFFVLITLAGYKSYQYYILHSQITAHSQVTNVMLRIENPELFDKLVKKWGLFNKKITIQSFTPLDVKKISVTLSPTIGSYDQYVVSKTDKTVLQSTDLKYTKNTLTIYVYLNPKLIIAQKDRAALQLRINNAILLALYKLSYPGIQDSNSKIIKNARLLQGKEKDIIYVEKN